jgi:hypothetical protein
MDAHEIVVHEVDRDRVHVVPIGHHLAMAIKRADYLCPD